MLHAAPPVDYNMAFGCIAPPPPLRGMGTFILSLGGFSVLFFANNLFGFGIFLKSINSSTQNIYITTHY